MQPTINKGFRSDRKRPDFNIESIARNLGKAQKSGSCWLCCCPAHDDHSPSLSLAYGDDGRLLMHCFAGCDARNILVALRGRGLLGNDIGTKQAKKFGVHCKTHGVAIGNHPLDWSARAELKLRDWFHLIWLFRLEIMPNPISLKCRL